MSTRLAPEDTAAEAVKAGSTSKRFRWLGALLLAVYLVSAVQAASHRHLWYDELYTLAIARQNPAGMWRAETAGFEFNPPAVYLLSSAALRLPLPEEISLRIPPIIGFALFAASLMIFAGRRLGLPYGLIAGSIVLTTGINTEFAVEARPYGILVGFLGLAFVGWQEAADENPRWRLLGLAGVAVGLAGALASHTFAILLYCPFGVAELWRWRQRRRVDGAMALALLIAAAPVILYVPLRNASRELTLAGPLYALILSRIAQSYGLLLMTVVELLPVLLLLWLVAFQTRRAASASWARLRLQVPQREWALAITLMMVPLLGYLFARLIQAPFFPRYALAFTGGFAILLAYAVYGWGRGRTESAWLFVGTAIAAMIFPLFFSPPRPPRAGQVKLPLLEQATGSDAIAVASGITFLEMNRYLAPALASRLVFIADPPLALKRAGSDGVDRPLAASLPWTKPFGNVTPYLAFNAGHKVFWWYGDGRDPLAWALSQWTEDGANIQTVATQGEYRLNRITLR